MVAGNQNSGGARVGAGRKKKPIADKISDGNIGKRKMTVMEFSNTADLIGVTMPEPNKILSAKQKDEIESESDPKNEKVEQTTN